MRKAIAKLYPKLAPGERFRLALEALARGDREEADRLAETCPRKIYSMPDTNFTNLLEASRYLVLGFSLLWLDALRRYQMLEVAAEICFEAISLFAVGYALGANNTWKRAKRKGIPFNVEGREPTREELREFGLAVAADIFPGEVSKTLRELTDELKTLWQGFAAFCREKALDPEKLLLAWWPPVLDQVREKRELLEALAPAEDVEAAQRTFTTVWERTTGPA